MRLYRLSKSQYAEDLSGQGARRTGGRWNLKGTSVIYTSDSMALATLEALVHSPLNLIPKNRSITIFELPDPVKTESVAISQLPENWRSYPPSIELAQRGTDWVNRGLSSVLQVPSVVIPPGAEWNYLLNPQHADFKKIQIIEIRAYEFDSRLFNR